MWWGRGFGFGRGFGLGRGVGPGWGRGRGPGNPYPYCRAYPWLPRGWWWTGAYAADARTGAVPLPPRGWTPPPGWGMGPSWGWDGTATRVTPMQQQAAAGTEAPQENTEDTP